MAITVKVIKCNFLTPHFFPFTLGEVMEDLAFKLLRVSPCTFQPTHARNLGNKFACFVNYDTDLGQ